MRISRSIWVAGTFCLFLGCTGHNPIGPLVAPESGDEATIGALVAVGYQGYGQNTTGGAGKPIYSARNEGQFDSILNTVNQQKGNAIIKLEGAWTYNNASTSKNIVLKQVANVTISGMGSDVVLKNVQFIVRSCNNIVIEGLRIRKNQAGGDALQIDTCQNVVIHHNSVSAAGDGNLDLTGYTGATQGTLDTCKNITVAYNILADTYKQSLVKENGATRITFHHNLFYNSGMRTPALQSPGLFDVRNNLIWQWDSSALALNLGAKANIIKNYFVLGTANPTKGHAAVYYMDSSSKAWISGNVFPTGIQISSTLSAALTVPAVTTQTAITAKDKILLETGAGAMPRDAYDANIVSKIKNGEFPAPPPVHL